MSTTANLKLFKHDNPTTNTNQFDVEKALNENWDKIDKNAGEVASKIQTLENTTNAKDTSQDTEIEVLKAENALLKSQIPSATVVGETIHLEDSSNMQCQIAPIGASKQETTIQSANLFDKTKISTAIGSASGYVSTEYIPAVTGDTIAKSNATSLFFYDSTKTQITNVGNWTSKVIEVENVAYVRCNVLETDIDTFMLVKNQGLPSEYVEFVPNSPSIEYEAPIESVGDNINYLPYPFTNTTKNENGITFTDNEDGTINIKGTATKDTFFYLYSGNISTFASIAKINNKKVVLMELSGSLSSSSLEISLYNADNSGKSTYLNNGTISNAITINNQSQNINSAIVVKSEATVNTTLKPMLVLEKESTGAYSPYGQGSVEVINSNKNLLNLGNDTFVSNGLNIVNEITKITVNGTLEASWVTGSKSKSCLLKPDTYTFSIDKPLTHHIYLKFTFEDGTTTTLQINKNTLSNKITTDKNIVQYNVGFSGVTSGTTYNETIYLQLEKGETATDYVEHQSQTKALYTQQPLRAIGDVKDKFVKVNGVWYEEHKVTRKELVGNESWGIHATLDNAYQFGYGEKTKKQGLYNIVSNYLPTYNGDKTKNSVLGGSANQNIQLMLSNIDFPNVNTLKEWLLELYNAGTPLYVDYVLAEPLLIPCTPEQVEVLENFNTYKNVTNISSDSIGELEVFYYKDLETLLGGV
jgi:hypothetical protein